MAGSLCELSFNRISRQLLILLCDTIIDLICFSSVHALVFLYIFGIVCKWVGQQTHCLRRHIIGCLRVHWGYKQIKSSIRWSMNFPYLGRAGRLLSGTCVGVILCSIFREDEGEILFLNIRIWSHVELDSKSGMYIVRRMYNV